MNIKTLLFMIALMASSFACNFLSEVETSVVPTNQSELNDITSTVKSLSEEDKTITPQESQSIFLYGATDGNYLRFPTSMNVYPQDSERPGFRKMNLTFLEKNASNEMLFAIVGGVAANAYLPEGKIIDPRGYEYDCHKSYYGPRMYPFIPEFYNPYVYNCEFASTAQEITFVIQESNIQIPIPINNDQPYYADINPLPSFIESIKDHPTINQLDVDKDVEVILKSVNYDSSSGVYSLLVNIRNMSGEEINTMFLDYIVCTESSSCIAGEIIRPEGQIDSLKLPPGQEGDIEIRADVSQTFIPLTEPNVILIITSSHYNNFITIHRLYT